MLRFRSRLTWLVLAGIAATTANAVGPAGSAGAARSNAATVTVSPAVRHGTSPPLRSIPLAQAPASSRGVRPGLRLPPKVSAGAPPATAPRPGPQSQPGSLSPAIPSLINSFLGLGQGFTGFTVAAAPPDPALAVGPAHIVQIVNLSLAIFNKSGLLLLGPEATNKIWTGLSGGCSLDNDGDATVEYDRLADRFIVTQVSYTTLPYAVCVAVSATGDPTGSYYLYEFDYTHLRFDPKLAVWPDGYYVTFFVFSSLSTPTYLGPGFCALDRSRMLAGQSATQQCFYEGTAYGGDVPSDLDSATPPPAGSPNYIIEYGTDSLGNGISLVLWKFHVDWGTPANSTLTGPTSIPVTPFQTPCSGSLFDACVPQSGTTQRLAALDDRMMYRLSYRNFGDHESLLANHTVTAGAGSGIRWYELRNPNGTPTIFQQGTYAPTDLNWRWMGSMAMDRVGDVGLGFSLSSSLRHPEIHYTGRLATDVAGTMAQGEGTIVAGSGSQTNIARWGDYSTMVVDPSDDCTFWYTNEYLTATGSLNWSTQIASFNFPVCTAVPNAPTGVTAAAGNASATVRWTAPTGGPLATGYQVTPLIGGTAQPPTTFNSTATTQTVTGLANGTSYTFLVAAMDASGTGPNSAPSNTVLPLRPPFTTVSSQQYTLTSSDGSTWVDMDPTNLSMTITPTYTTRAVLSGNADLWTSSAGFNQDLGIDVNGSIVAWKESGGFAGTFSPNAAYVQAVVPMTASTTYTVKLRWKTNKPAPGAAIFAGAGPIGTAFSPTRLTVQLVGGANPLSTASTQQYHLTGSDGSSWVDMDSTSTTPLLVTLTPAVNSTALLSGNADLWTANAGYNQDLGIDVNGSILAWKESGGFAGTFSPNAAFVQAAVSMTAGTTYTIKLRWKTNKPAAGATIYAGAGPIGAAFSPTRLTVLLLPTPATVPSAVSTQQYHLANSDGVSWVDMDSTSASALLLSITPAVNSVAIISGNVDLWTAAAGYNQDIAIEVNGSLAAWKESGGFAGTFSPNAAMVETVLQMTAGTTYTVKLVWKTNKPAPGATIYAGAGPIGTQFSPTRLTAFLLAA